MENETRKKELIDMFDKMAFKLTNEGIETNDFQIIQIGGILGLIGTLLSSNEDLFIFSEMVSMFAAKKIIDELEAKNGLNGLLNGIGLDDIKTILSKTKKDPPKTPDNE